MLQSIFPVVAGFYGKSFRPKFEIYFHDDRSRFYNERARFHDDRSKLYHAWWRFTINSRDIMVADQDFIMSGRDFMMIGPYFHEDWSRFS